MSRGLENLDVRRRTRWPRARHGDRGLGLLRLRLRLARLRARLGLRLLLALRLRGRLLGLLRALHVHAENPWRTPSHDHADDRVAARVAPLLRRLDEPALRERLRVVAVWVSRAAEEPLPAAGVPDDHLALLALHATPDDVPLAH